MTVWRCCGMNKDYSIYESFGLNSFFLLSHALCRAVQYDRYDIGYLVESWQKLSHLHSHIWMTNSRKWNARAKLLIFGGENAMVKSIVVFVQAISATIFHGELSDNAWDEIVFSSNHNRKTDKESDFKSSILAGIHVG